MDLNKYEANELTKEIATCLSQLEDDILYLKDKVLEAYDGRIWVALGYNSWENYVKATFSLPKLPVDTRRALTAELAENLPTRAIAAIEGVSTWTVRNDSKEQVGGNLSPPDSDQKSETKTGLDGKKYPKSGSKPHPQLPPKKNLPVTITPVWSEMDVVKQTEDTVRMNIKLSDELSERPPTSAQWCSHVLGELRMSISVLELAIEKVEAAKAIAEQVENEPKLTDEAIAEMLSE